MSQKYEIQELQTDASTFHPNLQQSYNDSLDSSVVNSLALNELMVSENLGSRQKKKIGNIRILFQNQRFMFTIGPDYICFLLAYIFFTIMHFVVIYTAANQLQNVYVNIVNVVISVVQNLSYVAVALSNPGIQTKNNIPTEQDCQYQIKRFCKKCSIRMQKGTYHCRDCDVCIRNYDHHCPWTSKCIGERNLTKFYVFVTSTMIYIVYCMVLLLVCMATGALQTQKNLKGKTL